MKQEHLGNGAYVTINKEFIGQIIFTANHHEEHFATDKVHTDYAALQLVLELYKRDIKENHT